MNLNIFHVGLDVDDTQYHGSTFNKETGEVIKRAIRPSLYDSWVIRFAAAFGQM